MVDLKIQLPKDFLKEEERCGYIVSSKMKEIWAVQLDLLAEFNRICRKHKIEYIASGGTMLGAVRHHGYIPWDDDIDVMMMRDQYEKFCHVGVHELSYPYFLQTEETELGSHRWFARLRNSETTAIQEIEQSYHQTNNQGIFIDIFPMDNVVDDQRLFKAQRKTHKKYYKLYCYFNSLGNSFGSVNDSICKKMSKNLLRAVFGWIIRKYNLVEWAYRKAEITCQKYNGEKTEYVSLLSFQFDNLGHAIHATDLFNIIPMDFEFTTIPVIANYDEHLRRKYGDLHDTSKNTYFSWRCFL